MESLNRDFHGPIQGVTGPPESPAARRHRGQQRVECVRAAVYSAAAANEGFTFADDTMKSEMRGTISDLKREPLKTP